MITLPDIEIEIDQRLAQMDPPGQQFACICGLTFDLCWHDNDWWLWPAFNETVIPIMGSSTWSQPMVSLKSLNDGGGLFTWEPCERTPVHTREWTVSNFGYRKLPWAEPLVFTDEYPF